MTRTPNRYSTGAIAFHWTIAALVITNYILIKATDFVDKDARGALMEPHKAIGITVLTLTVLRIIWRLTHARPDMAALKPWQAKLAKTVHALFYILLITIPLTGWMMASRNPDGVSWFGLFNIPGLPVPGTKAAGGVYHEVHEIAGKLMFVLILLHIAGALKHQYYDRIPVIRKMWPA